MHCPHCAKTKSRVIVSRQAGGAVWRQRLCLLCHKVFTTREETSTDKLPWSEVKAQRK